MPHLRHWIFGRHEKLFTSKGVSNIVYGLGEQMNLPTIEFDLRNCCISPGAGSALGHLLTRMPYLQTLSMAATEHLDTGGNDFFTATGLASLVDGLQGTELHSLVRLDLRDCNVRSAAARPLGSLLRACPLMEELDLSGNKQVFADDVFDQLFEALERTQFKRMKKVWLNECGSPFQNSFKKLLSLIPQNVEVHF